MRIERKLPDETVNYRRHSPLLEFSLLLGAFLGLVGLFYVGSAVAVSWGVKFVPQEVEALVFPMPQSSVPQVKGTHDTQRAKKEEFLQAILDRLVRTSPEIKLPLRVQISQGPEVNAFALPGGQIVVTNVLLESARSENEIAMVLAHEIGHFKLRHHLRGVGLQILVVAFQSVIGVEPEVLNVSTSAGNFMALSFSRHDEQAADEFGLLALNRAYGHVGGATDFFDTMAQRESQIPGVVYLQTHPQSADRATNLNSLVRQLGYSKQATIPKPIFLQ